MSKNIYNISSLFCIGNDASKLMRYFSIQNPGISYSGCEIKSNI